MCRLLLAALLFAASPAVATPPDALRHVIDQHWARHLRNHPVEATRLGVRDYDMMLGDISLEARDREAVEAQGFLDQLRMIPEDELEGSDRTDFEILRRLLREQVEANGFGARAMLFTTYYGWHQEFVGMADDLPFRTKADYDSYYARLAQYPHLNGEALKVTRKAVADGFVQPCDALDRYEKTIIGVVAKTPEESRFYAPFLKNRPADMSAVQWEEMKGRVRVLIKSTIEPEYRKFHAYYITDYKPKCRASVGASAMPQGAAWYAFRVREMTTTDRTPEQIHAIGLAEVRRIRTEMDEVTKKAGYASREAFIAGLRTDPKYYPRTPEELLAAAALQAKRIDGMMPGYFGRVARLPYGIKAIPPETAEGTTTAYYAQGSPESGIAGTYYVNTSKLSQRPLWELPALTAHEAAPGHHHQIALQQELDLPEFRKHLASFTAFVEGWALYTEHLGVEMGLYDTRAKDMGRLSYEMWRACRLVVDTGLHAKGWSKARAVAYMKDNTALSDANIEAEVNRYISWPGQALAYKMGELKIRELRARAEKALGSRFDLRAFHDAVLGQGAVPVDLLEAQIDGWIAARKR